MELTSLFILFLLGIIGLVGTLALVLSVAALVYAEHYAHSGEESHYTGRFLKTSWRHGWVWHALQHWFQHSYTPIQPFLLSDGPVLFVCQPHGVLALSAALTFLSGAADRPRSRVLVAVHSLYWRIPLPYGHSISFPGVRNLMLALGCIDRSRESIEYALGQGFSVAVLPGGVLEMGPPLLPLKRPLGILTLAWELGEIPIVPVIHQGEEDLCWTWKQGEWGWVKWLRLQSFYTAKMCLPQLLVPRLRAWWRREIVLKTVALAPIVKPGKFANALEVDKAYEETRNMYLTMQALAKLKMAVADNVMGVFQGRNSDGSVDVHFTNTVKA